MGASARGLEQRPGGVPPPRLPPGRAGGEQPRLVSTGPKKRAPAITEVSLLDTAGREQLRISRLAMDVAGSRADFSNDPRFKEARAGRVYYGPVYFRKESEPYMTLAVAGRRPDARRIAADLTLQ